MGTVLVNLWPYALRPIIFFLFVAWILAGGNSICRSTGMSQTGSYLVGAVIAFLLCGLLVSAIRYSRWIWRFAREVRCFETEKSKRVTLRYSPRITDKGKIVALLQEMEMSLQEMTERFGHPLGKQRFITPYTFFASRRRNLTAYLFHDREEAERAYGYRIG